MQTPLPQRQLGNTSIHVSPLGLGTVKFGRNTHVKYPRPFELPSDNAIADLLFLAKDSGINLLDTAPAYGNSETRIGQLLPGLREEWVICSKVGEIYQNEHSHYDFSAKHIIQSIDNSLRRLNTDYLDIALVHSNGDDMAIIDQYDVFTTLEKLCACGKIRSFGMSTKTLNGGIACVEQADLVMVTYNPIATDEAPVIQAALEQKKGVLIKKALASGHLNKIQTPDPVKTAFEFIFQHPGVHSVIAGTINPQHLRDNVARIPCL